MIRVALIGSGMIAGVAHIPAYRHRDDVFSVEAVCDLNRQSAEALAQKHGIGQVFTDAAEMLERVRPDLVSVCVPNAFHGAYIRLALEHGANVLCEKPLACTYAEAAELYAFAERQGKLLMACQSMRYTPDRQAAKRYAENGNIGDIYYASFARVRRRGTPTWGTFHMQKFSCGGAMIDIGVHQLDAMLWLMGNPEILSVSGVAMQNHVGEFGSLVESGARAGRVDSARRFDPAEMDVEDFASGTIRFANGSMAHITAAWSANLPESSAMTLTGKCAGLLLPEGKILCGADGEAQLDILPDVYGKETFPGHFHIMDNLADVFLHDAPPAITPRETIQVAAALDLFYRSARLGREVCMSELK